MKVWKSNKKSPPEVWTSEIRLKSANTDRIGKVNKLLRLLGEVFDENVSGDN